LFQPTRLVRVEGETLFVRVPKPMFRRVLTQTYGEIVKAVLNQIGMPRAQVQYVCAEEEPAAASSPAIPARQSRLDFESTEHQLNLRYTFDTFVECVAQIELVFRDRKSTRLNSS